MLISDIARQCSVRESWPVLQSADHGVREERASDGNYVPPEVKCICDCVPLFPSIIIITAPAAVGKSTAAAFLSNRLKAPILDLALLQVGDATLEGSLIKALGGRGFVDFDDELRAGTASLIIDALDEAEIRSGQANFQAFIRGVAEKAALISEGPSIILLSRAESARAAVDLFEARKIQYAHFEIMPFNEEQANRYLDNKLVDLYELTGGAHVHMRHRAPFIEARTLLFKTLASALSETADDLWSVAGVRDFVGYAPVLDVVAEYLCVDNFNNVKHSFEAAKALPTELPQWKLVAQVIDQLLVREQGKFVAQFSKTASSKNLSEALRSVLYSPEEQCARLLEYVEGITLAIELPAHLPDDRRGAYEGAVEAQLVNHPFLRGNNWFNVIFRDYVAARTLESPSLPEEAAGAVRKRLLSSGWKHSPMFGYFCYSLGRASTGRFASCHAEVFGALYESFKSVCESSERAGVFAYGAGDRMVGLFCVFGENDKAPRLGPLEFVSHVGNLSLGFPRELSNSQIYNVPDVMLGGDSLSFKMGPDVSIQCKDLLVSSSELQIYVNDADSAPVIIVASSVISDNLKIKLQAPNDLLVVCPNLTHPWNQYQRVLDLGTLQENVREAQNLYIEFRRLVLRFKDAKRGQGAVFRPLMDNIVIGENRRARVVMDYLQNIGCVEQTGSLYLLNFSAFAKLGISRAQLRDLQHTDESMALASSLAEYYLHRK